LTLTCEQPEPQNTISGKVELITKAISLSSPDKVTISEGISITVYVLMFTGMFVMTLVVMIQRFYKNLLSDEGYLMFTLPTNPWNHIVSKLLVSMMWSVASGIIAILSILIVIYKEVFTQELLQELISDVKMYFETFGSSSVPFLIELLILWIIGLASNILVIYASIALGHLLNKHRVLASLGAFIALNAVSQIIMSIITTILGT
jgi:hypothetical protein